MKKMITFFMAFIFGFNAYAFNCFQVENQNEKYIEKTITKIDKLIKEEEENPTSLDQISRKVETFLIQVSEKQKENLIKIKSLTKRERINRINKKIQIFNKMNPRNAVDLVTSQNVDEKIEEMENQLSGFNLDLAMETVDRALQREVSFKDILIQVRNRLLGKKDLNERKIASIDVDWNNILEIIANIVIYGALAVGVIFLLMSGGVLAGIGVGILGIATGIGGVILIFFILLEGF